MGDRDDEKNITLNSLVKMIDDYENKRIVVKMDIGGAGEMAIEDSESLLKEMNDL